MPYACYTRSAILQLLYGWQDEWRVPEYLQFDPLFRWFVGIGPDDLRWSEEVHYDATRYCWHASGVPGLIQRVWSDLEKRGLVTGPPFTPDNQVVDQLALGGHLTFADFAALSDLEMQVVLQQFPPERLAALCLGMRTAVSERALANMTAFKAGRVRSEMVVQREQTFDARCADRLLVAMARLVGLGKIRGCRRYQGSAQ